MIIDNNYRKKQTTPVSSECVWVGGGRVLVFLMGGVCGWVGIYLGLFFLDIAFKCDKQISSVVMCSFYQP